jgi:hypothetical protein
VCASSKPNVGEVGAVAGVPAERRPPEPSGLIDEEQYELKGVEEADIVELRGRSQGDRRVASVERPA